METITGRLTADAKVSTLNNNRTVVNFSVALNTYVKSKGATENKKYTTYVNCSWWIGSGVATLLKKGGLVEVSGRLFVTAYIKGNDPVPSLNCDVRYIKIHSSHTGTTDNRQNVQGQNQQPAPITDDLPF